jgi:hypothetical protein
MHLQRQWLKRPTIGFVACVVVLTVHWHYASAQEMSLEENFFETRIRPLLHERCLSCHSADENNTEGGLALDTKEGWIRGGGRGPAIIPGETDRSLLIQAVRYDDESLRMPPDEKLSETEIEDLKQWIHSGAFDPRSGPKRIAGMTMHEAEAWWAFQPIPAQVAGSIDSYLNQSLNAHGLTPLPQIDARRWIRRVTYDLTGLPPSAEEVEAFVSDDSLVSYEKVIDTLLASPRYGQRWGRHWLDLMRYADYLNLQVGSNRTGSVVEYYEAWKYRDWVVAAFNADMPYDRFLHAQIAGDRYPSLSDETPHAEGLIATTWMSLGPWDNGDGDKHKIVSDIVDDQINVIGQSFLGLTLACARCHDHKFDPVTIEDYYGLAGMFYSSRILDNLGAKGQHTELLRTPIAPPPYVEQRKQQLTAIADVEKKIKALETAPSAAINGAANPVSTSASEPVALNSTSPAKQRLESELAELKSKLLPEPPMAMAIREGGTPGSLFPGVQDVPVHRRGKYTELGEIVPRGLPRFLARNHAHSVGSGSGRTELADWLTDPSNPLPARVIVNRVWQWHFGQGLVSTPNNFGKLGSLPTHPELLDYLARRFVDSGWSIKTLQREILLSDAYRRASIDGPNLDAQATAKIREIDPDNKLYGAFRSRRLDAEEIRDTLLWVSDLLNEAAGGPADESMMSHRRTLYVQSTRYYREYYASLFDAADNEQPTAARNVSTVAPQALFFMNHPLVLDAAKHLAARIRGGDSFAPEHIDKLFRILFARPPTEQERKIAEGWMECSNCDPNARFVELCQMLLSTNELVYLD